MVGATARLDRSGDRRSANAELAREAFGVAGLVAVGELRRQLLQGCDGLGDAVVALALQLSQGERDQS